MADDESEQPTQLISRPPSPPGATATLEPHEPRLDDGGPGADDPPRPPTGYGGDGSGDGTGDDDDDGNDRRVAILASIVGILVVVVLFLVLKPGSKDEESTPVASTPAAAVTAAPTEAPATTPTATEAPTATPTPAATPPATSPGNGSSGGAPIDGGGNANAPTLDDQSVTKFTVSQGDTVTFRVNNTRDTTQEVHVHGYDKKYDVEPGETRTISFPASLTGIFDIEFESTATKIGELTVEP